ncbi:MAG: c-type cytochrome [Pseudomonadota bacterium]
MACAISAKPAGERLARIYTRSYRNCDAVSGAGAPMTGHQEVWAPRLSERGPAGLLQSTKYGYRFMPAKGLCFNYSDDDYTALIDFMRVPAG